MPLPLGSRPGRRLVGGILGAVVVSLACLVPVSYAAAGDDYPYAGLGKCPLVPLPPKAPAPHHTGPGRPGKPGGAHQPGRPGRPAKPDTPPPPRQCAKHIWFYNGSYGDPWGFALRNCTSFVAWRLRETNGLADFENHFGGVHWGNAADWDEAAAELGYVVDGVPAVGAVAQTDDGKHGHVAWVSAVDEGTVTVEEYNYGVSGGYGVRTVPTSSFRYLHLADTAPAPYLGSSRAGVATTDAHGGAWSARTTPDGRLVVRRPSGRTTRLAAPGTWSADAAPSVLTDSQGRIWVASVTAGGRVLTAHTSLRSAAFSRPRPAPAGSSTSSPALIADGRGRVHVLAVTSSGSLFERHTPGVRSDRWSRAHRLGLPGSWSTHAAPSVTADVGGRLWLAAITSHGRLLTQHTTRTGLGWSGFRAADRRTWSVTSTPAIADAQDGRVWLASVTERGDLVVRHTGPGGRTWQRLEWLIGQWSPYSSPSLTVDRSGRTWLASVAANGHLSVRSKPVGARTWRVSRAVPHVPASETESPTLASTVNGVLVGVDDGHGRAVWRRPQGPSGLPAAHGPRGGGFSVSLFL
jgi:surface antigen